MDALDYLLEALIEAKDSLQCVVAHAIEKRKQDQAKATGLRAEMNEMCAACEGTGLEEGEEWNGTPCRACRGRGFNLLQLL